VNLIVVLDDKVKPILYMKLKSNFYAFFQEHLIIQNIYM